MNWIVFIVAWPVWFAVVSFTAGALREQHVARFGDIADAHKHKGAAIFGWIVASGIYSLITAFLVGIF